MITKNTFTVNLFYNFLLHLQLLLRISKC